MKIGSHVALKGGLLGAAKEAVSYGASTFMVYTGAPQNKRRTPIEKLKIPEAWSFMREHGIGEIVVHAPYIVNLASCKESIFDPSVSFLKEEMARTVAFGSELLVLHPGSYTDRDLVYGIDRIAEGLNAVLDDASPCICLETMAGKGSEVGKTFEELRRIIDKVERKDKLGVCFDTCHTHDAGYDIVNNLEDVMKEFDETLGLAALKVFHLNGSLNPRGARKDRHANIGAGEDNPKGKDHIGYDAIYTLAHSKYAEGRPLILETPWLDDKTNLYKQEIELIRKD